jgi:hypothetical protein
VRGIRIACRGFGFDDNAGCHMAYS